MCVTSMAIDVLETVGRATINANNPIMNDVNVDAICEEAVPYVTNRDAGIGYGIC